MQKIIIILLLTIFGASCTRPPKTIENLWPSEIERYWAGPQFLSVPAMDWKLDSGRLVCVTPGAAKGVVMLTKVIEHPMDGFEIAFEGGFSGAKHSASDKIGFMLGLEKPTDDKVNFAEGIFAGISANGRLHLAQQSSKLKHTVVSGEKFIFNIEGVPQEDGNLKLILRVRNEAGDNQLGEEIVTVNPNIVKGFVSFFVQSATAGINNENAWFESLEITGKGVINRPENTRGPILKIDMEYKNNALNLTVYLVPLIKDNSNKVVLQVRGNGEWTTVAESPVTNNYIINLRAKDIKNNVYSYRVYTHYTDRFGSQKYSYVTGKITEHK